MQRMRKPVSYNFTSQGVALKCVDMSPYWSFDHVCIFPIYSNAFPLIGPSVHVSRCFPRDLTAGMFKGSWTPAAPDIEPHS